MVSALGAYPEAAEELVALGAEDMIVSAMNHNGNKQVMQCMPDLFAHTMRSASLLSSLYRKP